jgi:hypothetical protein
MCIEFCDKVCQWLASGLWFSPSTPVSPTNKTDRDDRTEILLHNSFISADGEVNSMHIYVIKRHIMLYQLHLAWAGIELTISVVTGYHAITATTTLITKNFCIILMLFKCFRLRPSLRRGVVDTALCDKVCQWLASGLWFSLGTLVSSTIKADGHNITEILLKVALNTINLTPWNTAEVDQIKVLNELMDDCFDRSTTISKG